MGGVIIGVDPHKASVTTYALFATGAALLLVFVRYERRRGHNARDCSDFG